MGVSIAKLAVGLALVDRFGWGEVSSVGTKVVVAGFVDHRWVDFDLECLSDNSKSIVVADAHLASISLEPL